MTKTILTGIKPTGSPHVGNYIGAIKPALDLMREGFEPMYFVADYHALTTIRNPVEFRRLRYEVAATWLALGLDPDKVLFYQQSDIPEIFELTWLLACSTSKGLMNRAHAYKAAVAENQKSGQTPDANVNMGLYNYPVLMAADIIIMSTDLVPVGKDQVQHVEMARDIAIVFNNTYGEVLAVPEYVVGGETGIIPGLDGRKMSKTYNNTIQLFGTQKQLRKQIFQIVTDSTAPNEPKDPVASTIFQIYKEFASPEQTELLKTRYLQGTVSWGEAKQELFEVIDNFLERPRTVYDELMANPARIDALLAEGAHKARERVAPLMKAVRKAIGR